MFQQQPVYQQLPGQAMGYDPNLYLQQQNYPYAAGGAPYQQYFPQQYQGIDPNQQYYQMNQFQGAGGFNQGYQKWQKAPSQNKKYKTSKCRHFDQNGSCSLGDNCSFAHGDNELRQMSDVSLQYRQLQIKPLPQQAYSRPAFGNQQSEGKNNYKTVKCKNFDQTGQCKYESHCTFAHGDHELRQFQQQQMLPPGQPTAGGIQYMNAPMNQGEQ